MPMLSLRARLLLCVLVLSAAGLLASGAFTYTSLRSFLLDRVDSTLTANHQGAGNSSQFGQGRSDGNTGAFDSYVQKRSADGTVIYDSGVPHFPGTATPSPPDLSATIVLPKTGNPDRVSFFTVSAQSGDGRYRVRASIDPGSTEMLIIATPLG